MVRIGGLYMLNKPNPDFNLFRAYRTRNLITAALVLALIDLGD